MDYSQKWLVETDWLAEHLDAPGIVILDASFHLPNTGLNAHEEYRNAHIPGAIFFDIEEIADTTSSLPHMLPPPEKFSSRVRRMGIGDGMRVVIYDQQNLSGAARAWWMFRVMGYNDVAVLNGGFRKWCKENRPVETEEPPRRSERHFTARKNSGLVRDLDDIRNLLGSEAVQIVDARSAERFAGIDPEPREVPRLGHIPGAKNLPYREVTHKNGTLLPPSALKEVFRAHNIDLNKPVVASCGSGVTACVIALAMATMGYEQTPVYDGSWAEWSEADVPVETGN